MCSFRPTLEVETCPGKSTGVGLCQHQAREAMGSREVVLDSSTGQESPLLYLGLSCFLYKVQVLELIISRILSLQ